MVVYFGHIGGPGRGLIFSQMHCVVLLLWERHDTGLGAVPRNNAISQEQHPSGTLGSFLQHARHAATP